MTEKRFRLTNSENKFCDMNCGINDENKILTFTEVVEQLNEFHDENQLLKFQLGECRNNKLFSRRQLEKENEQLKKEKEYFLKVISAMGDYAEMVDYEKIIDASDAVKRRFLND